ncbi:MAG: hypothetical protein RBU23_05940 [Candidatus Auribacterota bacterium]|jgi:hypothetical protein|nr:hypothetical protein [Candidatus Auribacterota bacterium]
MIICFNCNDRIKSILDGLIATGQYSDYAGVIQSALNNLVVLHERLDGKSHIVIEDNTGDFNDENKDIKPFYSFDTRQPDSKQLQRIFPVIPEEFGQLTGYPDFPLSVAEPQDSYTRRQTIAIDKWMFGQYNTLLPAKATCRALGHLLYEYPQGIQLQKAVISITESAARLGDYLQHHDKTHSLPREDSLATGFPSTVPGAEKAKLRYGRQFVGNLNQQHAMTGMLFDLKLVNMADQRNKLISLTEAGYRFAALANPVLDRQQEYPTQKFNREEIDFFLAHVHYSVPVEDHAYSTLLRYISTGRDTPEQLDTVLQRHVPRDTRLQVSKSFLASQRSGTISRMTDLELIRRERIGVKFKYHITDRGEQFMQLQSYATGDSSRLTRILHNDILSDNYINS